MKKSHLAALVVLTGLVGAVAVIPAAGAAPPPRASLPDIEDEVMCPTCGVPLALAFSPQAERERDFIRAQIARGKTKGEIKQALVSEYGSNVLALPESDKGVNWAVYVVPIAAVGIAAIAIAIALRRWRRRAGEAEALEPPPELSSAEAARLEHDLSRYDI
jgi:cytochrome c-type biogenesis protein CcmH